MVGKWPVWVCGVTLATVVSCGPNKEPVAPSASQPQAAPQVEQVISPGPEDNPEPAATVADPEAPGFWGQAYPADTTVLDDNNDTVRLRLEPYELVEIRGLHYYATSPQDTFRIRYHLHPLERQEMRQVVENRERCRFVKKERLIQDYAIRLEVQTQDRFLFQTTLQKEVLEPVFDRYLLHRSMLTGIQYVDYNPRYQQFIFKLNLAEQYGVRWWSEAYVSLNRRGEVKLRGLIAYAPNCITGVELTGRNHFLATCSELRRFTGEVTPIKAQQPTLVYGVTDSLFVTAYKLLKPSQLICDTVIYLEQDTFRFQDMAYRYDSLSPNVQVFWLGGDTLANYRYDGPISRLNYRAYFDLSASGQVFAFYNLKNRQLRVIPLSGSQRTAPNRLYQQDQLTRLTPQQNPQLPDSCEFLVNAVQQKRIRFYLDSLHHAQAYREIQG